ncbi:hypothetical protein D3C72_1685940 [compost metagenome]
MRVHAVSGAGGCAPRQYLVVAVDQRNLVILGEPPWHHFIEQAADLVGGHQAAHVALAIEQGLVVIHQHGARRRVGKARLLRRLGILAPVQSARIVGRRQRGRRKRQRVRQAVVAGGQHLAAGVEPQHALQFAAIAQHLLQSFVHFFRRQGAAGDVHAQVEQAFLVARQLEADGLLHPQRVGDQLLLAFVAFHLARLPGQPEQDRQEQQQQDDGQQPAHRAR